MITICFDFIMTQNYHHKITIMLQHNSTYFSVHIDKFSRPLVIIITFFPIVFLVSSKYRFIFLQFSYSKLNRLRKQKP